MFPCLDILFWAEALIEWWNSSGRPTKWLALLWIAFWPTKEENNRMYENERDKPKLERAGTWGREKERDGDRGR